MKNKNRKKVIFVSGTARSGSTMLDVMFGSGERSISLGEIYAHYSPWQEAHVNSSCPCGEADCEIRRKIVALAPDSLHENLLSVLDIDLVADSSKTMDWVYARYKELEQSDIEVINVVIYKDPISLAHSFFKRGQEFGKWIDSYRYYKKFEIVGLPYVSVNYDALIKDLPTSFAILCKRLDVEYFEGKENFWDNKIHHFFGSASVRKLYNSSEQKIFYNEKYVEGFEETRRRVSRIIEKEGEIKNIYKQLKRKDILDQNFSYKQLSKMHQISRNPVLNAILHPSSTRFTFPKIYGLLAKAHSLIKK